MFLGMQDFYFAQITIQFCPNYLNFVQISPKSNQICSNLTNFAKNVLLGDLLHPQLLRHYKNPLAPQVNGDIFAFL